MNRTSRLYNNTELSHLCILRINLNKSTTAQLDLINYYDLADTYDIVLIQELHIDFLGNMRVPHYFKLVFPKDRLWLDVKTCTVIWVNKKNCN